MIGPSAEEVFQRTRAETAERALDMALQDLTVAEETVTKLTGNAELKGHASIGPIGWLLIWQEYARRLRKWQFVGDTGLRSLSDEHGTRWTVHTKLPMPTQGMEQGLLETIYDLAETFGYDAAEPPNADYIMLTGQADRGAYDAATTEMDRIRDALPNDRRQLYKFQKAYDTAVSRNNQENAARELIQVDLLKTQIADAEVRYNHCRSVVEHAVTRHFLIPIQGIENLVSYGMEIKCRVASVLPPKRLALKVPADPAKEQSLGLGVPGYTAAEPFEDPDEPVPGVVA